jgi:hypothetical protein
LAASIRCAPRPIKFRVERQDILRLKVRSATGPWSRSALL